MDEDAGLLLGGNAFDRVTDTTGRSQFGIGEILLEGKMRFPVYDGITFGFEVGIHAPTAPSTVGIGKPAYLVNGIYSVDLGTAHLDINLGGARFTTRPPGTSLWQSACAAAWSRPITDRFGAAVEISGTGAQSRTHRRALGCGQAAQAAAANNALADAFSRAFRS